MIEMIKSVGSGALFGIILTNLFNYFKEKRERKDKYYFALLEKRFETAQKAIAFTEKLKAVINERDLSKRTDVINGVEEWYHTYCLYLSPNVRREFGAVIRDVGMYQSKVDAYHDIGRSTDEWDTDDMRKTRVKIDQTFNKIQSGIQRKIEEHIDVYYDHVEGKKLK